MRKTVVAWLVAGLFGFGGGLLGSRIPISSIAGGTSGRVAVDNGTYGTWVAPAGDVTGSPGSSTVAKLRGTTVSTTPPTSGQFLSYTGSQWTPTTYIPVDVTSVGLSLPGEFSVSGSPVTSSGTLTGAWASESANKVFAGPTSGGSATPAFRSLVSADLPAGLGSVTSVGLSLPGEFSVSGSPVTGSGTLTGSWATETKNTFFGGPISGSAATPAFRALNVADLGSGTANTSTYLRGDLTWGSPPGTTYTAGTGITLSAGAFSLTAPVTVSLGGTGATSLTGILVGNGTSAFTTVTAPSGAIVGDTDTQTLTNKRRVQRVVTLVDAATVTINADTTDEGILTTLSQATLIANPSGTPTDGQEIILRIKSGSARALTWGSEFRAGSDLTPLPATTTGGSKTDYYFLIRDQADTKWDYAGRSLGF